MIYKRNKRLMGDCEFGPEQMEGGKEGFSIY